jgi:hypothetical protein
MSGALPMKSQCLPFAQIPHTARLFLDYLSYTAPVREFYPRSPLFPEPDALRRSISLPLIRQVSGSARSMLERLVPSSLGPR